jgi:hypothetical protein
MGLSVSDRLDFSARKGRRYPRQVYARVPNDRRQALGF